MPNHQWDFQDPAAVKTPRPRLRPDMKPAPKPSGPAAPTFTKIPISGKDWKTRTPKQEWDYQNK